MKLTPRRIRDSLRFRLNGNAALPLTDELRWRSSSDEASRWKLDTHLVFTVTAGRTGTNYLAHLLEGMPGLTSVHEPEPAFSQAMRVSQNDPAIAVRFWERWKLPAIRRTRGSIYVETSHVTCKGFFEPLLDHGIVPDLILLERDAIETATSLYLMASIPARTRNGNTFLLRPDDPGVLQLPGWEVLDDWSLCYWYCREIERRMVVYGDEVISRGGKVLRTSLSQLKTDEGLRELSEFLGYADFAAVRPHLIERSQHVVNDRTDEKASFVRPLNFDRSERARLVDEGLAAAN